VGRPVRFGRSAKAHGPISPVAASRGPC
jgi:hypothetical protein